MRFLSLFAGIGGLDLGLERAGMQCVGQCEIDPFCRRVLAKYWPNVWRWDDVRTLTGEVIREHCGTVGLICGGDPCPKHSRARSNGRSVHPDLSGYYLSLVGRLRPWWVVRENVPAPTVDHFVAALEALGYGCVVVRTNSAEVTCQTRQRDFIVARHSASALDLRRTIFADCQDGSGPYETRLGTRNVTPCLTVHRTRYDSRDCFIWYHRTGLRILESSEREALAGFPHGWTAGFSATTRAAMYGNSVVPQVAEWIGRRIMEAAEQN